MGTTNENQRYYSKTKEYHKERRAQQQQRIRDLVRELKSGLVCSECGEDHPACIEFHHRNPSEKSFNVSQASSGGYSEEKIRAEISKCTVLCANCHRKQHWRVG